MAQKYTTIRRVIEKVFRDNGYTGEIDFYDAVEWAAEAMDLIGVNLPFEEKRVEINVAGYRGKMPRGWQKIISTREKNTGYPYRYETGTFFHTCHVTESPDLHCTGDLTYKVNNNWFFSKKEETCVEMVVLAYATDEEGLPMIPDETKYIRALASYIRRMADYRLWRRGKLARDIYEKSEQDWLFDVGSAETKAKIPSIDQMESFKNQILRLIPQPNEHANGFKTLGDRERRYNN